MTLLSIRSGRALAEAGAACPAILLVCASLNLLYFGMWRVRIGPRGVAYRCRRDRIPQRRQGPARHANDADFHQDRRHSWAHSA